MPTSLAGPPLAGSGLATPSPTTGQATLPRFALQGQATLALRGLRVKGYLAGGVFYVFVLKAVFNKFVLRATFNKFVLYRDLGGDRRSAFADFAKTKKAPHRGMFCSFCTFTGNKMSNLYYKLE